MTPAKVRRLHPLDHRQRHPEKLAADIGNWPVQRLGQQVDPRFQIGDKNSLTALRAMEITRFSS